MLSEVLDKGGCAKNCPSKEFKILLLDGGSVRDSSRKTLPAQPVDGTPSAVNLLSLRRCFDAAETNKTFLDPADRHVDALEGGTVVA
jgi:hypothetical protein